jgi:nucleoside-diphosphate-sugar epimerase
MNILLIGHEGYVGRGLLAYLSQKHRVVGWDKKENLFNLDAASLAREDIELLINLSVMADRNSPNYEIDTPTEEVNVMGAHHVARILKGTEIGWIQFSTREVLGPVYGPDDVIPTEAGLRPKFLVDEGYPYAPRNFYGKSKVVAEFISESHPFSNVIRLTTGYTDFASSGSNWVLALLIAVAKGNPVTLTRGGEQFRDPLHTDDLGHLIELIHERKVYGEKFHAGGGDQNLISLKEFVRVADPEVIMHSADGGDYGFAFDNSKATRLTGWVPKVAIRERIPVIVKSIRQGDGGLG